MKSKKREPEEILEEKVMEGIKEEIEKVDVPEYYLLGMRETISDVAKKFGIAEKEIIKLNGDTVIGGNQIKLK